MMADGVTTRDFDWTALCKEVEGEGFNEKQIAYQFGNGRKFTSPGPFGGVYRQEDEE